MKFSHREIPVMKTGVPAMRTGVPCNENRFFPVKKAYREFPVSLTGFGFAVYFIGSGDQNRNLGKGISFV